MKNAPTSVWIELTETHVVTTKSGKISCTIEGLGMFLFGEGGINHIAQSIHTEKGGGSLITVAPSKTYTQPHKDKDPDLHWDVTAVLEDYEEIKAKLKKAGLNFG